MTYFTSGQRFYRLLATLFLVALWSTSSLSAEPILLTIKSHDDRIIAQFTDADLDAMDHQRFETTTPWTDSSMEFAGPALTTVLTEAGFAAQPPLKLIAANDYSIKFDGTLMEGQFPIIAHRRNGAPFSLREKGPLWVIYPFEQNEGFQTEAHFSAAVWQLTTIVTLD